MTFLAAHAPDGLLAPEGFLGTSHRFLFKIGEQSTTLLDLILPYVPLESGRNVFAQPPTLTCEIVSAEGLRPRAARHLHDAIQADLACQLSSHVLPGGDALPLPTTSCSPQPTISLACLSTTGPMPGGTHSAHRPMRPWSILAMPRCQRFPWALFGARPPERTGQQKSEKKTEKNESFIKKNSMNFKDFISGIS